MDRNGVEKDILPEIANNGKLELATAVDGSPADHNARSTAADHLIHDKFFKYCEVLILPFVLLVLIALFIIPIALFAVSSTQTKVLEYV